MTQEISIENLQALKLWVESFLTTITSPHLILLSGEVGVGKTQTTSYIVEQLGGESSSPSFAIHNSYDTNPVVNHLDLYRLEDEDDLESVGFWDLFDEESLIIIEWADRLDISYLPKSWPTTKIEITKLDCQKRLLKISNIN